eukprot:8548026-Alexandrium_andersonii.AAC.1
MRRPGMAGTMKRSIQNTQRVRFLACSRYYGSKDGEGCGLLGLRRPSLELKYVQPPCSRGGVPTGTLAEPSAKVAKPDGTFSQ